MSELSKVLAEIGLQRRHLPIAYGLIAGQANTEIAGGLSLSVGTVENYVSEILDALRCNNRTQAALVLSSLSVEDSGFSH